MDSLNSFMDFINGFVVLILFIGSHVFPLISMNSDSHAFPLIFIDGFIKLFNFINFLSLVFIDLIHFIDSHAFPLIFMNRQTNRHMSGQTNKQTNKQTNRHINRLWALLSRRFVREYILICPSGLIGFALDQKRSARRI